MPTLNWVGKDKITTHHLDVPYHVLKARVCLPDSRRSHTRRERNKIIRGDNLETPKALLSEYEGGIKCIYINPPYNIDNDDWVYSDNVNDPIIRK